MVTDLSEYPTEALEGDLLILQSQKKQEDKNESEGDKLLSKIPDDVLDMAIKIKEKELKEL